MQLNLIRTYIMLARVTKQRHYLDNAIRLVVDYKQNKTITVRFLNVA